jgi:hypothetical protein
LVGARQIARRRPFADFGKFIAAKSEKWTKVIRRAGVKAE